MKPLLGVFTLAFLCFFSSQHIHSQSVDKGWTASFGVNAVNNPVKDNPLDIGRYKTWNMDAAGFHNFQKPYSKRLQYRKIFYE